MHHLNLIILISLFVALDACSTAQTDLLSDNGTDPIAAAVYRMNARPSAHSSDSNFNAEDYEAQKATLESARENHELIQGMRPSDVLSIWGEPRDVETAGLPGSGNERWTYFNGLSSAWSLSSTRTVYFEDGQVIGWETKAR